MYLIRNANGDYLNLPESASHHGARGSMKPWPPGWGSIDHAARFPTYEGAMATARRLGGVVLSLEQAWSGSPPPPKGGAPS